MAATTELIDAPAAAPITAEARRGRWWWMARLDVWAGLLVVAACCAFIFVQLEPNLLFRNTTPSGGDTAAHVWWPAFLRDHLLGQFRLAGWSPDFYAGFPAGQFYFPVPALLIVALDVILPYNVAFKLVTALGPIMLPVGAYVFARGIRAPRPTPAAFAVAATAFLFFTGDPGTGTTAQGFAFNQHIMGGTLASNLAGEYSFTFALAFVLAFFGAFAWSLRNKGDRAWIPAVLFAATVMSHLVVAIFAVMGALVIWLASRPLRSFKWAALIGVVGGLLTAVWTLPLITTIGYTTDMRYAALTQYSDYLFPSYIFGVQSAWPWQWGATLLIACALIGGIIAQRISTVILVTLAALCGLAFRFWESLQSTTVWNLRLLPFWYICIFLLMAVGLAEVIRGAAWVVRWFAAREGVATPRAVIRASVIGGLTVLIAFGALISIDQDKGFLPYWVRWNYRGYEDATGDGLTPAKSYPEYRTLVDTIGGLPSGRLLWEGNSQLNEYGSPLALMLLPYWTHGRIASMEGLYYEASATTPYHFMAAATLAKSGNTSYAVRGVPYRDFSQFSTAGVPYLQLMGVRYLAVHSTEAKQSADADQRLTLVATSPDLDNKEPSGWSIYRVANAPTVSPLRYQPVVVDGLSAADEKACAQRLKTQGVQGDDLHVHEWQDCIGVPWFDDLAALNRPLVASGPSSWQHAGPRAALKAHKVSLPNVRVTKIHQTDDSVSFHVSRTGVPVYVKTSFFPNWEVDGATGPYRATPNFMVVVPTSHDVTLRYGTTTAEWVGRLGTLVGIGAVIGIIVIGRRRRRGRLSA